MEDKEAMEYITEVNAQLAEASAKLEKSASVGAAIEGRAPALVEKLIKAGMLTADERETALVNLQDPLKMLAALDEIATSKIASVAETKNTKVQNMGKSGSVYETAVTKTAAERSSARSEADVNFERRFGLA